MEKKPKLSPPKGKFAKLVISEEEPEPSPEKPAPMSLISPVDLSLDQKIHSYDKVIIMCNHKSAKWEGTKAILEQIGDKGVKNEQEFAKYVIEIMKLANQIFYSKHESLKAFCKYAATLPETEKNNLFTVLIPHIANLALQIELMFPDGTIPLLSATKQNIMKVSRTEASCILANMFFCTIPRQKKEYDLGEYRFYGLMCDDMGFCQYAINEKLPFILTYFNEVRTNGVEGMITISRNCLGVEERKEFNLTKWTNSTKAMKNIIVKPGCRVEDFNDALQVDFANKYIGGGIDGTCLQEQILFVIYPELFITCLLCERMEAYEAIVVTGVQRYGNYKGYSESFQFGGKCVDSLEPTRDSLNRIPRQIVAIDALHLPKAADKIEQFSEGSTIRELNKAYVGFLGDYICSPEDKRVISTGKWGCGIFEGCTQYKLLIQWIAASEAGRDMIFCTFDADLKDYVTTLEKLKGKTVGEVAKILFKAGLEAMQILMVNPLTVISTLTNELLTKILSS